MVKELGQYLEEAVKEFLELVEGFDIVEQDHLIEFNHRITLKSGKKPIITSPSDIDIIGIKGKELWIIECKENLDSHDNKELNEKFKHAKRFLSNFSKRYKVKKGVACCKRHVKFDVGAYGKIFYFKDMITSLNESMHTDRDMYKTWLTTGRIQWLLKYMNYTKLLNADSKLLLTKKHDTFQKTKVWIFSE